MTMITVNQVLLDLFILDIRERPLLANINRKRIQNKLLDTRNYLQKLFFAKLILGRNDDSYDNLLLMMMSLTIIS